MLLTSTGRALAIVPRDWKGAPQGYVDVDEDDFEEGTFWHKAQVDCLKPFRYAQSQVRPSQICVGFQLTKYSRRRIQSGVNSLPTTT